MEEYINNTAAPVMVIIPQEQLKALTRDIAEIKALVKGAAQEEAKQSWVESEDARKMLGVSPKTWQSYRDRKVIPFSQFGRKIYVKLSDIEEFLLSHRIC